MSILKKIITDTVYAVAFRRVDDEKDLLFQHGKKRFKIINSPKFTWYADPILFTYDEKTWLFVERMDQWKHKGVISVARYINGNFTDFHDVLEEPFHLSYPMVFEKDGKIFMIPETADTKSIRLYRCCQFPDKWEFVETLADGQKYVDTNVVQYNNQWYLITGIMDEFSGAKTKTMVYKANEIEEGCITCMSDTSGPSEYVFDDRGGGQIFLWKQKIIRPAQCGDIKTYGKSVKLYDLNINNTGINEKLIGEIGTTKILIDKKCNITGTHTYGYDNGIEVIDVKIVTIANPILQIRKAIRRIRGLLNGK